LTLRAGECAARRALGPLPHSLLTRFARFVFALKETLLGFPQRTSRRALPRPQLAVWRSISEGEPKTRAAKGERVAVPLFFWARSAGARWAWSGCSRLRIRSAQTSSPHPTRQIAEARPPQRRRWPALPQGEPSRKAYLGPSRALRCPLASPGLTLRSLRVRSLSSSGVKNRRSRTRAPEGRATGDVTTARAISDERSEVGMMTSGAKRRNVP
jgi:hypothetical protein